MVTIKTEQGLASGFPASDLQDNTQKIDRMNKILNSFKRLLWTCFWIGVGLMIWALKVHLPTDILRAIGGKLCYC